MAELVVRVDRRKLLQFEQQLAGFPGEIHKAMAGAINDTTRKEIVVISKAIRQTVAIKKKDIDPHLKRVNAVASANPVGKLVISKSRRLKLEYFQARQTKRGVTYRIDKGHSTLSKAGNIVHGARQLIPHAFIAADNSKKPGIAGHIFLRKTKKRLPIGSAKRGPSPWGVFVKTGMQEGTVLDVRRELYKNLDRRVKLALLRKAGTVK